MKVLSAVILSLCVVLPAQASDAQVVQALQKRCASLEQANSDACGVVVRTEQRLKELERKVSGMQKQITILHAKLAAK